MTTTDPNGTLSRRIINRIGRPFGINPFPRAFANALGSGDASQTFDRIYQENYWGSPESRSGVGSEQAFTAAYLARLRELLARRGLAEIFDAPCGDLNWIADLLDDPAIRYAGGDISPAVVDYARRMHPQADVRVFDIITDPFPQAQVWHCRDCLFHLPFDAIVAAFENFSRSQIPFALFTTHRARLLHRNLDVDFGGFRFLDLERAPFHLPAPIEAIPDYRRGHEFPRYVGLWSREQVAAALRR